jgi:ribosomal protein S18 acetylase RimI-like enzyme
MIPMTGDRNKRGTVEDRLRQRIAQPADHDFARETHHLGYRDVSERQFGPWDELQQDAYFETAWARGLTTILLLHEAPCGYAVIQDLPAEVHVGELVIHPRYQGRGVGTAVMQQAMERASQRGVPLRLRVLQQNRARILYQRLGLRQYGATATHFLMEWTDTKTG